MARFRKPCNSISTRRFRRMSACWARCCRTASPKGNAARRHDGCFDDEHIGLWERRQRSSADAMKDGSKRRSISGNRHCARRAVAGAAHRPLLRHRQDL